MKTQISFLTMIFSLSLLMFLLTSSTDCHPERIHEYDPNKVRQGPPSISKDSFFLQFDLEADFDDPGNEEESVLNATYSEVLESLEFEEHPDWGVAIEANSCIYKGQTLLVYNPKNSDINFYDSERFSVYWFKDGKPIRSTQNRLACVCKGKYAVIVIYKGTNKGLGLAIFNARACAADLAGASPATFN